MKYEPDNTTVNKSTSSRFGHKLIHTNILFCKLIGNDKTRIQHIFIIILYLSLTVPTAAFDHNTFLQHHITRWELRKCFFNNGTSKLCAWTSRVKLNLMTNKLEERVRTLGKHSKTTYALKSVSIMLMRTLECNHCIGVHMRTFFKPYWEQLSM